MSAIGGILLAAGEASRFGAPKQAARIGEEALLQRASAQLQAAGLAANVVVLGAHVDRVAPLLPVEVARVVNPHWSDGMLGSLQAGLRFLLAQRVELAGIFVTAADQPGFTTAHIEGYLRAARREEDGVRPVVTAYARGYGLPFVLPQSFFDQLLALPPTGQLRPLLRSLPNAVALAEGPHLRDIDTQEDLEDWLAEKG